MIRRYLDVTVAVLLRMYFGAYLKLWMPESDFAPYRRWAIVVVAADTDQARGPSNNIEDESAE
jgi:NAD(P)H-flavin reductase